LSELIPGEYPVKLSLPGFKPWGKIISVEPGKAAALERILLEPVEWKREVLSTDAFEDLIPLEGTRLLILTQGDRVRDYVLFDRKEKRGWPLFPLDFSDRDAKVLSHFAAAETAFLQNPFLLLRVDSRQGEAYYWIELKGKENEFQEVTSLFPRKPLEVLWDAQEKNILFSFQEGSLSRLDLKAQAVQSGFTERLRGFGIFNKAVYTLNDQFEFQKMDLDGKTRETLLKDAELTQTLFGKEGFYKIRVLSKDLILFLGENGKLLANRLPYRFFDEGALGSEFDPKRKRLLVRRERDLSVIDFSKEDRAGREERIFERGPEVTRVFEKGERIEQAFWMFEGSHILFRDQSRVFLLEFETHGKPLLTQVTDVKKRSSVFYSEESGRLYYLDPASESLMSLELLPRSPVISGGYR
jgi:hypothetical protein